MPFRGEAAQVGMGHKLPAGLSAQQQPLAEAAGVYVHLRSIQVLHEPFDGREPGDDDVRAV